MRNQRLSSDNKNNSRTQQNIGTSILNMNEYMINPFSNKSHRQAQSKTQPDQSPNTVPLADLQSHLLNLWTSYSVDDTYQNLFLVYIQTFSNRKEQAKQIEREIKKTYQKSSLYFLLQENIVLRTEIKQQIQEQIQKENQNYTTNKSSSHLQSILKQLCDKLKNLRRINLLIAQNIIKIFEDFKVTRESSLGSIGKKYIEIFTQIDQENDFIKQSFLNQFILFQKGFDPFFLVHYEEIMKSANPKTLKKHQPVSELFDMNISYVYRLMRAQQKMLKYLLLIDDQIGTEKERKQLINRQRIMKINTPNSKKQKSLPQSRHSNTFLPSIHKNDPQSLTQNSSALSTIKPFTAVKYRKPYQMRTPDNKNHAEDSECSDCVRKKAFSLRPFQSKEIHSSLNSKPEYYPQTNQQRKLSLQNSKNSPLYKDSYKPVSTKNFETQDDSIFKRQSNRPYTYQDEVSFSVENDQAHRSKPFGSSQSQKKWNIKHALKDRRRHLRPIKTRQTEQDSIIQEENSDQQNESQSKKPHSNLHPIRSRMKKLKLAGSEIQDNPKYKPSNSNKKIELEKQMKRQKQKSKSKLNKDHRILESDSDENNDIENKKQTKNKNRSKYQEQYKNQPNSKSNRKLQPKSKRNQKQRQKQKQKQKQRQRQKEKENEKQIQIQIQKERFQEKNNKNKSYKNHLQSSDSQQEKYRKKSASSSNSFSNAQKSQKYLNKKEKKISKSIKQSQQYSQSSVQSEKYGKSASGSSLKSVSKSSQQSMQNHKKKKQKSKANDNSSVRENSGLKKDKKQRSDALRNQKQNGKDKIRKTHNNEKIKNLEMQGRPKNDEQQYQKKPADENTSRASKRQKQRNNESLNNISKTKEEGSNPQKKAQKLVELGTDRTSMNGSKTNIQPKKSQRNESEKQGLRNEENKEKLNEKRYDQPKTKNDNKNSSKKIQYQNSNQLLKSDRNRNETNDKDPNGKSDNLNQKPNDRSQNTKQEISNKNKNQEQQNPINKQDLKNSNRVPDKNQSLKSNEINQESYDKNPNQKSNDKNQNQQDSQNKNKNLSQQNPINNPDVKNLNQSPDRNSSLKSKEINQNRESNDKNPHQKSNDRIQRKQSIAGIHQNDEALNIKSGEGDKNKNQGLDNNNQNKNADNKTKKLDDKALKNRDNQNPDKKETVNDHKNNGANNNNNVNTNSQVKQPQQSKIKIVPGKISLNYFPQYIKSKQIHPSYANQFKVSLQFILKSVQKTQTYLNEFHLNDQLAVIALCSPTSSGNMVIYLWAPIEKVCDEKQSLFFFKKYLDYIENQTTFKSIMYGGQEIPELKSEGFEYQKDRYYLRKRVLQIKREDFEFEYFFSMEATNISFFQSSTQSLLYSDQITPFSQSNSWCNSIILMANPNSLSEKFKDEWKIEVAIKTIHEANALLQKASYDTFEVGEEKIKFQNINMSRCMITKVPKYGFIANQGFMIIGGKTLTFLQSKKKVSRISLLHDVNLYFGSEFKTVQQMALTLQRNKQKAKQQESKFAFKMFSKQLYGKYLLKDDKLEKEKAYYCNWDINFAWRDQIPGKILHDLGSIKHKYGPQQFILVVEMKGEIALGAEILADDFLY